MRNKKKIIKPFSIVALSILIVGASIFLIGNHQTAQTPVETNEPSGPVAEESSQPSAIGDISHDQVQKDASIDAIIDSSQKLENGNLLVKFHHNSNKEEPVSVIGNVRYELSKTSAMPSEEITLTVFGWSTEYFEIKVGTESSITGFGRKSEALDSDEVVLRELSRLGIDKKNVILEQDYGRSLTGSEKDAKDASGDDSPDANPYTKTYRDTDSGKRIVVVSNLPMVDDKGMPVDVGWEKKGSRYVEKNNLFKATVDGDAVELTVKNDQGDGRKKNERLAFTPQLFLNGVRQSSSEPVLLPVDPGNPNYQKNVLEWDYGIAKRRLRVIEGNILGAWVFPQNPNGDVRIVYNQEGDYKLKLGVYKFNNDEERIPASEFNIATYPFEVSDSATFNPNADPESTSVDGSARDFGCASWSTKRAAAGNQGLDSGATDQLSFSVGSCDTNQFYDLRRQFLLFDTSSLPDTAEISAATLSLYGQSKSNVLGDIDMNIYSSAPASNTALVGTDYASLGSTAFSTTKSYSSFSTTGYNDFALNSNGINQISLTGISKFGTRTPTYDVSGNTPTWSASSGSSLVSYMAEQGSGYKPKLVITYTPDSCTYSSGNWAIKASHKCVINATTNLGGNNITITGTGTFKTGAKIFNWKTVMIKGTDGSNLARVTCSGGCFQK